MKGHLSTHVLDISNGKPAIGVKIELSRLVDGTLTNRKTVSTDVDGRAVLLDPTELVSGVYELTFHVGNYFRLEKPFLDEVPVRFRVESIEEGYHVPLLVSPWAYSTYRGS